MNKKELHVVTGMTRDVSTSKFNPNYVFDAKNIRITAMGDNTTALSVTNEKGPSEILLSNQVNGTILGTACFSDIIILFTKDDSYDRIYKIIPSTGNVSLLFEGSLGFQYTNPIQTLPIFETEDVMKVYWIDGVNQPRVINICNSLETNSDVFNFVREVSGNPTIEVEKYNTGGQFPSGMVQYCFSYFNKFGQETAIVATSPMYFLSPKEYGLSPDSSSSSSFKITLSNLDSNFEYVRVYAIVSTSENSVQSVRIVGDYKVRASFSIDLSTLEEATVVEVPDSADRYGVGPMDDIGVIDISTGEIVYNISDVYDTLPDVEYEGAGVIKEVTLSATRRLYNDATQKCILISEHEDDHIVNPDFADGVLLVAKRNNKYYVLNPESDDQTLIRELSYARLNTTPVDEVSLFDAGTYGSAIDKNLLLFLGGTRIVPQTMATKDNVLFFGNVKESFGAIGNLQVRDYEEGESNLSDYVRKIQVSSIKTPRGKLSETAQFYDYNIDNGRSARTLKSFKSGENYRLGFVAQDKNGHWSDVAWLGDFTEKFRPEVMKFEFVDGEQVVGDSNVGFEATIPQEVVNVLKAAGYNRIAPVVVYPNATDRFIVCQGLLSGTVYNVGDRADNTPFVQADWRFRDGYSWKRIEDEIQSESHNGATRNSNGSNTTYHDAPTYPANTITGMTGEAFVEHYREYFYRDPSILTFHSPDIEFDDSVLNSDFENTTLYIVGISGGSIFKSGAELAGTPAIKQRYFRATTSSSGVWDGSTVIENYFSYPNDKNHLKYTGYLDTAQYWAGNIASPYGQHPLKYAFKWYTYLWHRHGSLNGETGIFNASSETTVKNTAKLKTKCISEFSFGRTIYVDEPEYDVRVQIENPKLCTEDAPVVLIDYNGKKVNYYGNIDKIISRNSINNEELSNNDNTPYDSDEDIIGYNKEIGYPILASELGPIANKDGTSVNLDEYNAASVFGQEPVYMKYKSTKHLVIPLKVWADSIWSLGEAAVDSTKYGDESGHVLFWTDPNNIQQIQRVSPDDMFPIGDSEFHFEDYIYVAELRRTFTDEARQARFGGTSKEALAQNDWVICGDAVPIENNEDATIRFEEGDTYVGRYDCLKTYPYTQEDENSIVSIYSTEIESRVNLDLRYDKNRGLTDNTLVTPQNFNLFNRPGYDQTNRFFTYHSLDYDRFKSLNHPNMLTWSLEKTMGEEIDSWTSHSLMSTADLQGDLGEITALTTFGDNIFAFQNSGFAQILFNSRVQIPTSDGQPIEITNGLKYGGVRYLSKQVGLTNKWSLCDTSRALYFVDDSSKALYRFSSQLENLGLIGGMNTWFYDNATGKDWNPVDFENIRTYYDKINSDVYFTTKNTSLLFSEQLGKFTSFIDYEMLPAMLNVNNGFVTFKTDPTDNVSMWKMWGGKYNMFFGEFRPYWLTFVSNDGQIQDKVFDNLDWRSSTFDENGTYKPFDTFDTLRVWHDYQDTGETDLSVLGGKPSSLKKKFNVFRALVPRDIKFNFKAPARRDRIRNPWAYIKFAKTFENTDRFIFNDLVVSYFE